MYAVKPFNEDIKINVTSTMYQCKSYFSDEAVASLEQVSTHTFLIRLVFSFSLHSSNKLLQDE